MDKPRKSNSNMKYIKGKDTSIEVVLRRALWQKGFRYRKNYSKLPGKPDIVLPKYKIAVFCDGEFFHGKDWESLRTQLARGNNSDFWIQKITRNMIRDQENDQTLAFLGWTVIHFWGKDILSKTDECVRAIEETIFAQKLQNAE